MFGHHRRPDRHDPGIDPQGEGLEGQTLGLEQGPQGSIGPGIGEVRSGLIALGRQKIGEHLGPGPGGLGDRLADPVVEGGLVRLGQADLAKPPSQDPDRHRLLLASAQQVHRPIQDLTFGLGRDLQVDLEARDPGGLEPGFDLIEPGLHARGRGSLLFFALALAGGGEEGTSP
jgi:hypothetical protein